MVVAHAAGNLDRGQLGDQNGAGIAQLARDGRLVGEDLVAKRLGAPGGRRAGVGDDVLEAVGNAVQGATIESGLQFRLGKRRFAQGNIVKHRRDGVERPPDRLQTVQAEPGQLDRRQGARAQESAEFPYREEGDIALTHQNATASCRS